MFKASNQTVFILGAGASWHYGYPTGEGLVKKVIQKASIAARFFEHSLRVTNDQLPNGLTNWQSALNECQRLKSGLEQVNPLVIDYYLGWNPELQNIGRLLIAWVILECEHESRNGKNINRPPLVPEPNDDWCRFIIHQLAIHCRNSKDLLQNYVSFVTFNYDVSLEHALRKGLKHIQMFDDKDVATFLGGSRIVHIYGRIRDDVASAAQVEWDLQNQDLKQLTEFSMGDYHTKMKTLLDLVYNASRGLRVIDPHDKGADDTEIMVARSAIAHARRVFILGYGFDEHNSGRLNLRETLRHATELADKRIAFTNYQDINQINKRASKLFYGGPQYFPPGGPAIQDRYEKSIRNTYDALALDFDLAD
jgi:hypothetical protein